MSTLYLTADNFYFAEGSAVWIRNDLMGQPPFPAIVDRILPGKILYKTPINGKIGASLRSVFCFRENAEWPKEMLS